MSLLHLQFSSVRSPPSLPSKSSIPTACAAQSSFPSSSSPASKSSRSSSSALSSPSTKQKDHQHHNGSIFGVRSSLDTVGLTVGQVTEVNKDTFWPIVNAAGDKTVVLDMYTQWCGPCKIIAPKFQELSEKYSDVVFLKLDCNQENKPLAKELGIRVVPTFKILKDKKVVTEVTGAKFDDLVSAVESARAS
ncbi:thioredoxin F-type, chloroplastic-like [Mangifera indica]|uniref:thioredoxin F-type, chloroplastic-like n=1 Tax=Mangifera indica TaxID=29780 RepID=UPI001CF94F9F|nr:thioredoxin F-type, chloroplastic-like [Mangifera indica]